LSIKNYNGGNSTLKSVAEQHLIAPETKDKLFGRLKNVVIFS